jgi:hypothetical protein
MSDEVHVTIRGFRFKPATAVVLPHSLLAGCVLLALQAAILLGVTRGGGDPPDMLGPNARELYANSGRAQRCAVAAGAGRGVAPS